MKRHVPSLLCRPFFRLIMQSFLVEEGLHDEPKECLRRRLTCTILFCYPQPMPSRPYCLENILPLMVIIAILISYVYNCIYNYTNVN